MSEREVKAKEGRDQRDREREWVCVCARGRFVLRWQRGLEATVRVSVWGALVHRSFCCFCARAARRLKSAAQSGCLEPWITGSFQKRIWKNHRAFTNRVESRVAAPRWWWVLPCFIWTPWFVFAVKKWRSVFTKGILHALPLDVGLPQGRSYRTREGEIKWRKEGEGLHDLSKECVSGGNEAEGGLCVCVLCFSRAVMIVR